METMRRAINWHERSEKSALSLGFFHAIRVNKNNQIDKINIDSTSPLSIIIPIGPHKRRLKEE